MTELKLRRRPATALYFTEDLGDGVELEMAYIPAGEFWMGTPENRGDESPQHFVQVPQFFMGKYPITQAQWLAVMGGENPSHFQNDFDRVGDALQRPVENISWYDAELFCDRLTAKTGKPYYFPSEAEWEYACRAVFPVERGEALTRRIWNYKYHQPFHFGETISTAIANYQGNRIYGRGSKSTSRGQTTPVNYFGIANRFGLCEMHGNVRVWCLDYWHKNYKEAPADGTAWMSDGNEKVRVNRGGSWGDIPEFCSSTARHYRDPNQRFDSIGFRVTCNL